MLGLTRDFVQQGGTFMVLAGSSGIHSDELSKVEAAMITAARIPRFLPLHVQEIDLQVTLRYDITEKKMLSHMLKGEKINMTEYYSLLLQIADTLEESVMYMLQPGKYILDEDYIFVDGSLQEGTLYLAYIPLERTECLRLVKDSLKDLVTRFMASVTELSGGGVQQLLQYTSSEEFTVNGFKKRLLDLLTCEDEPRKSATTDSKQVRFPVSYDEQDQKERYSTGLHGGANHAASAASRAEVIPYPSRGRTELPASSAGREIPAEPFLKRDRNSAPAGELPKLGTNRDDQKPEPEVPDFLKSWSGYGSSSEEEASPAEAEEEQKAASSRKTFIALGCLLAAALVWRMIYMSAPSSGKLILCVLLTVILAVIAIMGWSGRLFASKKEAAASGAFEELPDFGSVELSAESRRSKSRSRFEIEQLTGFFRGSAKKDKGDWDSSDRDMPDPEPDWKWSFPESQPDQRKRTPIPSHNQRMWNHAGVALDGDHVDKSERDYYSQLVPKTEILNSGKGSATVLLSGVVADEMKTAASEPTSMCYLLREGDGGERAERIDLRQQHFVIGRSEEVSQYVEVSVGASRAHVELSRTEDGGYLIKDLGSKNGTRLKGETMVPYKEYPLHDGDKFIIAKGAYTFRSA
ncbi:FHA domain-containing protein [Paenibacillus sp. KQZ6P-2]|uniref:FHA domain-containing protein n=1 Tax=Paenibacillus mangrovi TaxID=2931978 RepID=A0A9X1WR54_9BACL|nr:DUF6382 domain-containing protein [Paenibacillus mangrovi]MCJ8013146.1 FHA domain-containing protein [Paenibacillus mangrovi]